MGNKESSDSVRAARHLLKNRERHKRSEGNVQSDVESLLRAIEVGSIESQHRINRDSAADIYLPNRRAVVEVKAYPKAKNPNRPQSRKEDENPKEQLERYLRALSEEERRELPGMSEHVGVGWVGIVTDGSHWTVYRYTADLSPVANGQTLKFFAESEAEKLVELVCDALGNEKIGKEWAPQKPHPYFMELKERLESLYENLPKKARSSTETKRALWFDMMRTSGMVPSTKNDQERLFLSHTFLIVAVRMVGHTLVEKSDPKTWEQALKDGFASWVLDFARGRSWAEEIWRLVDAYDWRKRRGDVLRDMYHEFVSEKDRKVFGEYYTPDWLAELMVAEICDDEWIEESANRVRDAVVEGVGLLDPTCGSGTFLYHAVRRIRNHESIAGMRAGAQANVICRLINGLDIHPVAVEMARVNVARALPMEPSDGESAYRVFLGDSLQTTSEKQELFGHTSEHMRVRTPQGNELDIPMWFVAHSDFAERMRRMVNAAANRTAMPKDIADGKAQTDELEKCHVQLEQIIQEEGNSVWTWYVTNLAGPHLLAERKVDRIVANPPWVRFSDIQVEERKRAMEQMGRELKLQEGGKQAPNLDIASFFVLKARELYLGSPQSDPAVWLVKRSALTSGQWSLFRGRHAQTLAQSVDLVDLQPFGGGDATRSCLLFEHRFMRQEQACAAPRLRASRIARGNLSTQELLEDVRHKIRFDVASEPISREESEYRPSTFRSGARVAPHVLLRLEKADRGDRPGHLYVVTQRSTQSPWKSIPPQEGWVPETWVRPTYTSTQLLPYTMNEPVKSLIPADEDYTPHQNPSQVCPFWDELEEIYETHSGAGKSTPKTLIQRVTYLGGLGAQKTLASDSLSLVVYPASGDIMRASRIKPGEATLDDTLYWGETQNSNEAAFLVSILNAACLRRAFLECRDSGRDFHLHPWKRVPIPRYDPAIQAHVHLADLCSALEAAATSVASAYLADRPDASQESISRAIRAEVEPSENAVELERIVGKLFPEQATTS